MPTPGKVDRARMAALLAEGAAPAAIAAELGVGHAAVSYWRARLGHPPCRRWSKCDPARLRELHALGWADQAIADAFGCLRGAVTKMRRRLGLPAHRHRSATFAAKMRAHFERRTREAGTRGLRAIYPGAYERNSADLARAYGLPADLFRAQVRVLLALADGPRTAALLADAAGRGRRHIDGYHRFNVPSCPGGNYLADLRRRGLIALVGKSLWTLTPLAMDLMTAKEEPDAHPDP